MEFILLLIVAVILTLAIHRLLWPLEKRLVKWIAGEGKREEISTRRGPATRDVGFPEIARAATGWTGIGAHG